MSDFELARNSIKEMLDYPVLVTTFENESEQRRLKVSTTTLGFKIQTPALTLAQYQTYRTFFTSKFGALTSFTFTNPFDGVEYNVRFKEGTFEGMYEEGYYRASFEFVKVNV